MRAAAPPVPEFDSSGYGREDEIILGPDVCCIGDESLDSVNLYHDGKEYTLLARRLILGKDKN